MLDIRGLVLDTPHRLHMERGQGNLNQHFLVEPLLLDLHTAALRILAVLLAERRIRQMLERVVGMLPQLEVGRPEQSWHLLRSHKLAPHILSSSSSRLHVLVQLEEVEMWQRSLVVLGSVEHMDLRGHSPVHIRHVVPPLFRRVVDSQAQSSRPFRSAQSYAVLLKSCEVVMWASSSEVRPRSLERWST